MTPNGCRHGYGLISRDLCDDVEFAWAKTRMNELRRAAGLLSAPELQRSEAMVELDRRIRAVVLHNQWLTDRLKDAEAELGGLYQQLDNCGCAATS